MKKNNKAFTLIEILVTISIVTVLMGVTLYSYSSFNDKVALTEAGQEMLIAIRQAQSYSINVRETSAGSNDFTKAYGVYFNVTSSPKSYYIFIDQNGDGTYTDALGACAGPECLEKVDLDRGIKITGVTIGPAMGATCGISSADSMIERFNRPAPFAIINFKDTSTGTTCFSRQSGTVTLTSAQGQVLNITTYFTGQVAVQ